jgi:uncharacterized membrane protein YdbT with pleckstrin-like domain
VAYPSRLLDDDESVTVDLHPHWWYLTGPVMALVVSIIASVATLVGTDVGSGGRTVATWVSLVALGVSSCWLVGRYARWATTQFVVTSRRVIFRAGVFRKRGVEIPLDRVNTVHFAQGLLERLVGAGDLMIESAGETGQQRFTDVRHPGRVQRVIHAEMEARELRRVGGGGVVDVAAQLEKLEAMLLRGTLTSEEFDRQKRRLLGT